MNCISAGLQNTDHTANDLKNCQYYQKIKNRQGVNTAIKTKTDKNKNNGSNKTNTLPTRPSKNFQQATLDEIHTPANGPGTSKKQQKRFNKKYRPNVSGHQSTRGVPARGIPGKPDQNHSNQAGNKNNITKSELVNIISQFMHTLKALL